MADQFDTLSPLDVGRQKAASPEEDILTVEPVEFEIEEIPRTTQDRTITRTVKTPGPGELEARDAALEAGRRLRQAQAGVARRQEEFALTQAGLELDEAEAQAKRADEARLEMSAIQGEKLKYADDIAKFESELSKVKDSDFWADKTTGQKIGLALGVLLAGLGSGMAGAKSNAGVTALNNAMDRDTKKRRVKAAGLERLIEKATNLSEKDKARRIAELRARTEAEANEGKLRVQRKVLEYGKRFPQWQAQAAQLAADIDQEIAEDRVKQAQSFGATEVTKISEKAGALSPEARIKYEAMFRRSAPASAIMSDRENTWTPKQRAAVAEKMDDFLTNMKWSDNPVYGNFVDYISTQAIDEFGADEWNKLAPGAARYFNSMIEVANQVLRRESGAAVSASEFQGSVRRHGLTGQSLDKASIKDIQGKRDADTKTLGNALGLRVKRKGK